MVRRYLNDLNSNTPLFLIKGLLDAYNVEDVEHYEHLLDQDYRDKIIQFINNVNIEIPDEHTTWSDDDYISVSEFINLDSRTIWTKSTIKNALRDILSFDPSQPLIEPFRFEHRTPEYPTSLDPVSCYDIACYHNIRLNFRMTYFELANIVRMLYISRIERGLIGSDLTNKSLIKKLSSIHNIEEDVPEYHSQQHPLVKNDRDAIIQSVLNWRVDISLSENPMVEYYSNYGKAKFQPYTKNLIEIFKKNPFRLQFGTYFNREIPIKYYGNNILNSFYMFEGVEHNVDNLLERSITNNFHHLIQPEVKNTTTDFTLEDISDINTTELISYGVLSANYQEYKTNVMKVYTLEELSSMFQASKTFMDAITGEKFTDESIVKLSNICIGLSRNAKIERDTKQRAKTLKNTIDMIIIRQQGLNQKITEWLDRIQNNERVIDALNLLLDAGMYMRAWQGPPHSYPLGKTEVDDQDRVDRETSLALIRFQDANSLLEDSQKVDQLPLVKYFKGHFVESDSTYEGHTIRDRIEIINKGTNVREMSSCIRMSSNFIIASAYRYLQIIGQPPKFSISNLIDVS